MKDKVTKAYQETQGATQTVAKIATIAVPAGLSVHLGVQSLTIQQMQAVGLLLVSAGFGFVWLRRR